MKKLQWQLKKSVKEEGNITVVQELLARGLKEVDSATLNSAIDTDNQNLVQLLLDGGAKTMFVWVGQQLLCRLQFGREVSV